MKPLFKWSGGKAKEIPIISKYLPLNFNVNIDHIIPQSALLYNSLEHPNFLKCWALENLRPLDARENILKRNKIITENKNFLIID